MSGNGKTEMVKIILDDEEVEVPAGINLIEAAALHGKEVPHYCYHPKLTVVGNYDQAFSDGFGITTTPRVSAGAEYRLVPWFPTRIGLTLGGRSSGSSVGLAFGPFNLSHGRIELLNLALVTRGGFFPGIAQGTAISINFFKLEIR